MNTIDNSKAEPTQEDYVEALSWQHITRDRKPRKEPAPKVYRTIESTEAQMKLLRPQLP